MGTLPTSQAVGFPQALLQNPADRQDASSYMVGFETASIFFGIDSARTTVASRNSALPLINIGDGRVGTSSKGG